MIGAFYGSHKLCEHKMIGEFYGSHKLCEHKMIGAFHRNRFEFSPPLFVTFHCKIFTLPPPLVHFNLTLISSYPSSFKCLSLNFTAERPINYNVYYTSYCHDIYIYIFFGRYDYCGSVTTSHTLSDIAQLKRAQNCLARVVTKVKRYKEHLNYLV